MVKKVSGVVLIIMGLGFIIFGSFLAISGNDSKTESSKPKEQIEEMSQEEIDKLYNRERNSSPNISKRHCLDGLCIKNMQITYENNAFGVISADVCNVSKQNISSGVLQLNFQSGGNTISAMFVYPDLGAGEQSPLEIHYVDYSILSSSDYSILSLEK